MSSMCRSLRMSIAGSLPNKKFKKHCHRPRDARATSTPRSPVNWPAPSWPASTSAPRPLLQGCSAREISSHWSPGHAVPRKWHVDPKGFLPRPERPSLHTGESAETSKELNLLTLASTMRVLRPGLAGGRPAPAHHEDTRTVCLLPGAGVSVQLLNTQASLCLQPFCQQLAKIPTHPHFLLKTT